jgi:DNA-binding transcriptional regulator LsrR (DeoR family)
MSFSGGLTQNQIEVRLEALQAKAHRLITTALKSSIVRVEIAKRSRQYLKHEDSLRASAKLRQFRVGMGRTLKSAIEVLPKLSRLDRSIVSVSGSLTCMLSASPYDAVQAFQAREGGEGY